MRRGRRNLIGPIIAVALAATTAHAQDILTYRGAERAQRLFAGAKAEGQVVLYSSMIVNQAVRPLADAFGRKYPDVKISYWRGDVIDIMSKVGAEMRAGNLTADVLEGSLGEFATAAEWTQPFYTPEVEAFPDNYRDPRGVWAPVRLNYFGLAYNTKLVPRDRAPKSYDDLLAPQWTGKMAWRPDICCGNILFISNLLGAWGEARTRDYLRKLARQKLVNFGAGSARTLVDRVLAGEYPIAINIFAHHPLISAGKGASIDARLLDPVPATAAEVLVPKGARHPHAALLFIDFLLSREGQQILAAAEYYPGRRDVAPLPSLEPVVPSRAGVPENFIDPAQQFRLTEPAQKLYDEIFR